MLILFEWDFGEDDSYIGVFDTTMCFEIFPSSLSCSFLKGSYSSILNLAVSLVKEVLNIKSGLNLDLHHSPC